MSAVVTLPYDPLWAPVEWAQKNCPSYICNTVYANFKPAEPTAVVNYYFDSEEDATLFTLKWL